MGISTLKDKVIDGKNGVKDHLPTKGNGAGHARGGTEEDVANKVNQDELPSEDDSDESDEGRAKSLVEFVDDEDSPGLRRRYGELP